MKYYTGGITDFVEDVLKGAAKAAWNSIDPPAPPKADKPKDDGGGAAKAIKDAVDGIDKKARADSIAKFAIVALLFWIATTKGRR